MSRAISLRIFLVAAIAAVSAIAALFAFPHTTEATLTDGLVGHWTFDGPDVTTTVTDRSGSGNNGYFTGGATSSAKVSGKLGQAFQFDGANDNVGVGSSATLTPTTRTISAWIYPRSLGELNAGAIMISEDGATVGWVLALCGGFAECDSVASTFYFASDFTGTDGSWYAPASTIQLNAWQHVAITYDCGNSANVPTLYYNGQPISTTEGIAPSGSVDCTNDTRPKSIGSSPGFGNDVTFDGKLDDVRVYNRALTAAEVKQLYLRGNALQKPPNNLGLVGYWSFNEGTSTKATDFSGNGRPGIFDIGIGEPRWTSGKRGQAVNFDGDDDNIEISNPIMPTGDFTYAAWVKMAPGSNSGRCIVCNPGASDDEFEFNILNGKVHTWLQGDSVLFSSLVGTSTWSHVVIRRSGSNVNAWVNGVQDPTSGVSSNTLSFSSCATYIGLDVECGESVWTSDFLGDIDEVRIYNRALGATEIAALYGGGSNPGGGGAVQIGASTSDLQKGTSLANGLVGHWTFDGVDTQTTITDRSGSNNNGYFVGGATSSAKVSGKLGQALNFDGANDSVNLPTSAPSLSPGTGAFTMAMWTKWNALPAEDDLLLFARSDSTADEFDFELANGPTVQMTCQFIDNANAAFAIDPDSAFITNNLGRWIHYACVRQGTTVSLYTDGVFTVSGSNGSLSDVDLDPADGGRKIGNGGGATEGAPAVIDDVRMYNRALTAAEVKQLYLLGGTTIRP